MKKLDFPVDEDDIDDDDLAGDTEDEVVDMMYPNDDPEDAAEEIQDRMFKNLEDSDF